MKRRPKDTAYSDTQVIRLWTHAETLKAWPYIRSLVTSIREHWLALHQGKREAALQDRKKGRPDRHALIHMEDTRQNIERAEEALDDALRELVAIDVYCLDPANGLALIPFRKGDNLAWFVFDLFEPEGLQAWRFHHDPLQERRPITDAEKVDLRPSATGDASVELEHS
jgi:hypothetical protein